MWNTKKSLVGVEVVQHAHRAVVQSTHLANLLVVEWLLVVQALAPRTPPSTRSEQERRKGLVCLELAADTTMPKSVALRTKVSMATFARKSCLIFLNEVFVFSYVSVPVQRLALALSYGPFVSKVKLSRLVFNPWINDFAFIFAYVHILMKCLRKI